MFELLVSFLLLCGVAFTKTDSGQIKFESDPTVALEKTRNDAQFEPNGGEGALDAIIITDGTEGKDISTQ